MHTFKLIEQDRLGIRDEALTLTVRGRDMAGAFGVAAVLAGKQAMTLHVYQQGTYLITYCGGSPYWEDFEHTAHQIGSHGWCHECHGSGKGYVHHLPEPVELAVLTEQGRSDSVLRRQLRADGMTAEQYAASVAGRAVPLYGEHSHCIGCTELGADLEAGTARFAVDMWDMTTRLITVPLEPGAPAGAVRLAEEQAFAEEKHLGPCSDCQGTQGRHAGDCRSVELGRLLAEHLAGQPS